MICVQTIRRSGTKNQFGPLDWHQAPHTVRTLAQRLRAALPKHLICNAFFSTHTVCNRYRSPPESLRFTFTNQALACLLQARQRRASCVLSSSGGIGCSSSCPPHQIPLFKMLDLLHSVPTGLRGNQLTNTIPFDIGSKISGNIVYLL